MVEAAADIAMANLDVNRFLRSGDELELRMMQRVAARVAELQRDRDVALARFIRNEVIEGLGGK